MKKKILITGGCGFIGSNLCIFLKKRNFSVYSLDNLSRKGSKYNLSLLKKFKIKNYNIDISNFQKIRSLPKFDVVRKRLLKYPEKILIELLILI